MKDFIYKIKRPYHLVKTGLMSGLPAQFKFNFPARKLKIIAITGTDGKTTSASLLYHVLKTAGKKTALLSTVAAYIGDEKIETGLHVTSPNPNVLHQLLSEMVSKKVEYLVLEFTSHGAFQHRLWGIKPYIAAVTNIDHEHLDYHLTYANYLAAKLLILRKAPTVVLNADDQSFFKLKQSLPAKSHHIEKYSQKDKLSAVVRKAIEHRFPERFNQMNSRMVNAISKQLQLSDKDIAEGIKTFPGVPGRMQFVPSNKKFEIVVDFAHTPQGLEAALEALRRKMQSEKRKGRLIAVYGCAGLRDRRKRPTMGRIGVKYADCVIFTAEDPRTEDVWSIIRQMKEQITDSHNKIISIADRKQAIEFALNKVAKKNDIVGIFGKGPEKSMCYGTTEVPWSDVDVVKQALRT